METWRYRAIDAALRTFNLSILESDEDGRQFIAEYIIGPVWGQKKADAFVADPSTHQYCCDTVHYWWRCAGFLPPFNLASPGRMVYSFAQYNPAAIEGGPHWCVFHDVHKGAFVAGSVHDLHKTYDAERLVLLPTEAQPGDCLVHWTKDDGDEDTPLGKSWGGHGMLVMDACQQMGTILVMEGNSGYSLGPSLKPYHSGGRGVDMTRRQGIGFRMLRMDDPYCDCVVRPSWLDFDDCVVGYYRSLEAAKQAAAEFSS